MSALADVAAQVPDALRALAFPVLALGMPNERVWWLYLAVAALLALAVWAVKLRGRVSLRRFLFAREVWLHRSALLDYRLMALRALLDATLFAPFVVSSTALAFAVLAALTRWFGGGPFDGAPLWVVVTALTVATFAAEDLARYLVHRLSHRVPALWELHKVHHSAEALTPFTVYRTHPLEGVLMRAGAAVGIGLAVGGTAWLFRQGTTVWELAGVHALGFLWTSIGGNLRHSHVWLSYGRALEHVLISPAQHQIHHSRDERDFDRNFGVSLAIWDRLFGSLMLSGERTQALREGRLRFGVRGASAFDLQQILLGPFVPSHSPSRWGSHLGFNAVSGVLQEGKGVDVGENPKQTDSRPTDEIEPKGSSSVKSNLKINLKSKLAVLSMLAVGVSANAAHADLTIYTDRPTARVQTVADEYTQLTGEKVTIVEMAYGDLVKRLNAEGAASPADVLFVKDLVYLAELANDGRLQPMVSTVVDTEIAPQMKDPKNLWTAVTIRGRTLVYDPSRVDAKELKGYEDLADVKWAGRICVRTSKSAYNEALVAGLIEVHGYLKAKDIVDGWVQNLAADPMPNDNAVLEAVANGTCDVGITNTYYLGAAIAKNPAFPVRAHFADQNSTGMFGNGTGAGVAVNSKQSAAATKFIELLLSEKHQLAMSAAHFDYPAKMGLVPTTLVKDWGTPKYNDANWTKVGGRAAEARTIFSEVNYK